MSGFIFFVGTHQPSDAGRFAAVCLSMNRLERRCKRVPARRRRTLGDSGAFTKVNKYGGYPEPPEAYARKIHRLHISGIIEFLGVVAEDYMCEPFVVARTGLSIEEHQGLAVERYDALVAELYRLFEGRVPFRVMPVLQGQTAADYTRHLALYGDRITPRMWVGVGSLCKRQGKVAIIADLLAAIKAVRPDIRLHGFGVKLTALRSPTVQRLLFSADSMAWSFEAAVVAGRMVRTLGRELGRRVSPKEARAILADRGAALPDANDWRTAAAFIQRIKAARSATAGVQHVDH